MPFDIPPWDLVLRSIAIYLVLLLTLRIFGKREIGQFTLFDLVMVLLVSNAVQPAMTGPDTSLLGGIVIIFTLVIVDRALAEGRRRLPWLRTVLQAPPTRIARNGRWLMDAVNREKLDPDDLEAALREHGVGSVSEVALAVLEPDGSISIVPRSGRHVRPQRRRVRVVEHR